MNNAAIDFKQTLVSSLQGTVYGVETIIHNLCIALMVRGHVLLEGPPGLGKTLLARSLAMSLDNEFRRVQCTADLMPSDITGIHIYDKLDKKFKLMKGPLFTDILLADEINRTGPKTQSAMLEAMEERSITIDRQSYKLSDDFMVIATQNPHDFEGTYPLPESQLDRFLFKLTIPYPNSEHELQILKAYDRPDQSYANRLQNIKTIDAELLVKAREYVSNIHVSDAVYQYCLEIAHMSREHSHVSLGLSTRGTLALMMCARAEAALHGAEYVTPDDIKTMTEPVMSHRLQLTADALLDGNAEKNVVAMILDSAIVHKE